MKPGLKTYSCFPVLLFPSPKHTSKTTKERIQELEKLIISLSPFTLGRKSKRGCKMLEQGKKTGEKDYSFQTLSLHYLGCKHRITVENNSDNSMALKG